MSAAALPAATLPEAETLLDKAARCRRLARQSTDVRAVAALTALAVECEARAAERR